MKKKRWKDCGRPPLAEAFAGMASGGRSMACSIINCWQPMGAPPVVFGR